MHEIRYTLPHLSIAGLSSGSHDKPLIVALHGWLDNAASFVPLSAYLQDYHLVAIDFAGHGLSANRSADAHYHLMDFVHDLHELVLSQGWEQFILLGHSMGGVVGSLYTSCFPEKVSRYITIESFGPLTKTEESSSEQLRESIESRLNLQSREAQHPESFERTVEARAKAGDLTLAAAETLVSRNLFEQDGELRWRTDRRLRTISSLRVTEGQARHFMQNIQCPVLAISGDKGYKMMREKVSERQDWIPQARFVTCEGGHHLHMDYPEPIAQAIEAFLSES